MIQYPIAVAGIFSKQGVADPLCSICFLATEPQSASVDEVQSYICSVILPQLAQMIPNSSAPAVTKAINKHAADLESHFDVKCQGYLNEACLSGSPPKDKEVDKGDEN